jgi:hypothetical protein
MSLNFLLTNFHLTFKLSGLVTEVVNGKTYFYFSQRKANFDKIAQDVSMFDTAYDYESIMHYAAKAFSLNEHETLDAKEPGGNIIMVKKLISSQIFHNKFLPRVKTLISVLETFPGMPTRELNLNWSN